jgi:hypothetical protein
MDVYLHTANRSPSDLILSTTVTRLTATTYRVEIENIGP